MEHTTSLVEAAVARLQRGDGPGALPLLQAAVKAGASPPPWLLLAQAARLTGDEAVESDALKRALAVEAGNLRALLMRADWLLRAGDPAQAMGFYKAALGMARPGARLAADIIDHLRRAERWVAERTRALEAAIQTALVGAGHSADRLTPRLQESLEILAGRAQPQLQQPRSFYFAGLPQIAFHERAALPWLDAVEAAAPAIRAELAAAEDASFSPYVTGVGRADPRHDLLNDPSWSALHLTHRGVPVAGARERFPSVFAALEGTPLVRVRGRHPMALFSRLMPRTRIAPHHGTLNTRLIVHLPLVVPHDCGLRVGNQRRAVESGRAWAFDDTIEHEAWNDSGEPRTILIFEVWRPELSAEERAALTVIFETAEANGATLPGDS